MKPNQTGGDGSETCRIRRVFLKSRFTDRASVVAALRAGNEVPCSVATDFQREAVFRSDTGAMRGVQTLNHFVFNNPDLTWHDGVIRLDGMFAEATTHKSTGVYGWLKYSGGRWCAASFSLSPYHPPGNGFADLVNKVTPRGFALRRFPDSVQRAVDIASLWQVATDCLQMRDGSDVCDALYGSLIGHDPYNRWLYTTLCEEPLRVYYLNRLRHKEVGWAMLIGDSAVMRPPGTPLTRYLCWQHPEGPFVARNITRHS